MLSASVLRSELSGHQVLPMPKDRIPLLDVTVARHLHLPLRVVVNCCRRGYFPDAVFDRASWHWRIPLPLRLSAYAPTFLH